MCRYKVTFELEESEKLEQLSRKEKFVASKLTYSKALLLSDRRDCNNNQPFNVKAPTKPLAAYQT